MPKCPTRLKTGLCTFNFVIIPTNIGDLLLIIDHAVLQYLFTYGTYVVCYYICILRSVTVRNAIIASLVLGGIGRFLQMYLANVVVLVG